MLFRSDKAMQSARVEELEPEAGVEIGYSMSWDREKKEWKVNFNRYIRVPDREKKTVTTYRNVEGTGSPVLIEYLDDRPEWAAFLRTHELYNQDHERLCRELGVPGVWDDVCVEGEKNRNVAGTQRDEGIEALTREIFESSEYKEARGRIIAEGQHHSAATSQPNDGEDPSIVGKRETNRERLVRELLESSAFKEAQDRLITEVRHHPVTNSRSNGEEPSTVVEQEANDDGDEDVGKWGPTFSFTWFKMLILKQDFMRQRSRG